MREVASTGGLSITVRPQRAIALRTTRDGIADPSVTTDGVITASANRVLALHIDDLVDIEVTAGETSARLAASELRSRWEREGASALRNLEVETVEELDALCRHAEATLRAADDKRRDAEQADLQAARQALTGDTTALTARVTELEAELGGADVAALASSFERLGDTWQATLKQRTADAERTRQARGSQLDRHRAELTRLETQLEGLSAEAGRLADEASRRQADLADTWSVLVARHRADLAGTDRDIADIARQLQAMSGAATDEELAARTEAAQAESGVAAATKRRDRLHIEAQQARDAAIEASTTLASVRARARELDISRGWESALQSSSALPLSAWTSAVAAAEAQRDALKLEKTELRQQLDLLVGERSTAILGARAAVEAADARARVTRTRCDELQRDLRAIADQRGQTQAALAELHVRAASNPTDAIRQTIVSLRDEIAALEGSIGTFDAGDLERRRQTASRLAGQLRDADDDLARARGALEQVGGAIVREHQRDLALALQQALEREHGLEVEFDAWKLLLDTLRASEASEGAHSDEPSPARSAAGFASSPVAATGTSSSVFTSKRPVSRPPAPFATSPRCPPAPRTSSRRCSGCASPSTCTAPSCSMITSATAIRHASRGSTRSSARPHSRSRSSSSPAVRPRSCRRASFRRPGSRRSPAPVVWSVPSTCRP
jgi:chromosome segregation ATPase